ncbi:MAG: hypothetical protein BMS9Abin26_2150 [Gammaproteobacteria bacterium]|nr:MAG: hypothetical protein BMS9Abin26_2150 [Gammaproteobacteria bacterium]
MPLAFKIYMASWIVACIVAAGMMIRRRHTIELFTRGYRAMLLQNWKVATFAVAATGMVVIAPYTGDYTWDYIDASFMSLLAFTTAPWVVGILFRCIRYMKDWSMLYIAVSVWMFSVSWSYDGYLVLRDGMYPFTWLPNIFASSVLYFCAGLLWSLEWREGRGVHFAFTEAGWPQAPESSNLARVIWYGLPFMIIVAVMIIAFLF